MQTQTQFRLCFPKINIIFFWCTKASINTESKIKNLPKTSPKIKNSFFEIISMRWWTELLSILNIIPFLAKSSLKLHEPFPSNATP